MLDRYLEATVQNKLRILHTLQFHGSCSAKEFCQLLKVSNGNITNLIAELNDTLDGLGHIQKSNSSFCLTVYDSTDFWDLLLAVYQTSDTLKCLKYLLLNDTNASFSAFIEEYYVAKSSAYRIRRNCIDYLQLIGLDLDQNHVVGDEFRIRYLIALLYFKYGISFPYFDWESQLLARNIILSTNDVIDMDFLEYTQSEYGFFECLLILSWKRKAYPLHFPEGGELEKLKALFIYDGFREVVCSILERVLHISYSEVDCTYLLLAFCSSNSCFLSDKWTETDISLVHSIVFSQPACQDLLRRLTARFGQQVGNSAQLRSLLVYFYKKSLMELQCLIPDKNYYQGMITNPLTLATVDHVRDVLEKWKAANGLHYPLGENHIIYLALQIDIIFRDYVPPVAIVVVSDMLSELKTMSLHFSQIFSPKAVNIQTLLLNAQKTDILRACPNSVIVVNHKFKNVLQDLYLSESMQHPIVVPVNTELTAFDMEAVFHAISLQENRNYWASLQELKE